VSKFLGFLLGAAVALAGPAVFGVLAAPGGIELNTKGMALAFGIGALIFWTVVSYFSGAGALGAFVAFGTMIYAVLWIPNRMTNFLNDVPGVTTGMIEGTKQYTRNGVVPILAVISLVYGIQLIVQSVQRRRRERAEAERLQREQEAALAQQEADAAAVYPVAGATYPVAGSEYGGGFSNSRYDDLFDDESAPVRPRSQADEQTTQFPTAGPERTAQFSPVGAESNDVEGNNPSGEDETVLVPTDRDETVVVPTDRGETATGPADGDETVAVPTDRDETVAVPADQDATVVAQRPVEDEQTVAAPVQETKPSDVTQETPSTAPTQTSGDTSPQPSAETARQPSTEAPTAAASTQGDPAPTEAPAPPQGEGGAQGQGSESGSVEAADSGEEKKDRAQASVEGPRLTVKEQGGQQYRERMDGPDPEDTGEFSVNAFENPANTQGHFRAAGA
jgi:hypothetical protein